MARDALSRIARRMDADREDKLHLLMCCGGSSGEGDSKEARDLYAAQADTAKFMLGLAQQNLPGAVSQFSGATSRYFDPAYEARMVGTAGADAQQAIAQNTAAMGRNLQRYGINPNSGRFAQVAGDTAIQGAGLQAGAMNAARRNVQDKQFGASKDFFSALVGLPSDAANAAGNAAAGFSGLASNARQDDQAAANGMVAGARLGYDVYNALRADGGMVYAAGGGLIAGGGLVRQGQAVPPPPGPAGPSEMDMAVQAGKTGLDAYKFATRTLPGALDTAGAAAKFAAPELGMAAEDLAMTLGNQATATTAGTVAAEGAATAAGATAAEGAAAAGASGAMGAVGAALPWVGAAMLIADLFKADGGYVEGFASGGQVLNTKTSMVDYLKSKGMDSSFATRKKVFEAMYGEPYKGTAEQNSRAFSDVKQYLSQGGVDYAEMPKAKGKKAKRADTATKPVGELEAVGLRAPTFGGGEPVRGPVDPRADAIDPVYPEGYFLTVGRAPTAAQALVPNPMRSQIMRPNMRGLDLRLARGAAEGRFYDGGRADFRTGGDVDGPGTATSDSIPARLSDGEFVVNAEAVNLPGVRALLEQINNAGLKRRYGGWK